jgi:diguanylate cyclase (GGDEF)-like protein
MRCHWRDAIKAHSWMDYAMIFFVFILICILITLSITSVYKQIDNKKNRLLAQAARLESNLKGAYQPFQYLSMILQNSFEADAEPDTAGVIGGIQYDEDAKLSYLQDGTIGFNGTLASPLDLQSASDAVKKQIARVIETIGLYDVAATREYYFISRDGYAVFFRKIGKSTFLDDDGTYTSIAGAMQNMLDLTMELQAASAEPLSAELPEKPFGRKPDASGMEPVQDMRATMLTKPYENAFGDGMVTTYLEPLVVGGEIVGVLACDIRMSDLDLYLGHVTSTLGTIFLLMDTDNVLGCYTNNESRYDDLDFEQCSCILEKANVSREDFAALKANSDGVLLRGDRVLMMAPVQCGGLYILYVINLFALLTESNLILWFVLCLLTVIIIIMLIFALIHSRRKILRSNLNLQENIRKLDYLNHYDKLTGLLTSESIIEKIDHSIKQAPVIVMMMDIDNFKQINDNYLHTFGNVVLKRVASIIREYMPQGAYAGRFGGDEFLCLLLGQTPEQACEIAERIRSVVEMLKFREHEAVITVSIGIARSRDEETRAVLERADKMLYSVKKSGKNRWMCEGM